MSDLLFDTPLWILATLAVVGIGLFIAGNRRVANTLRNIGSIIVGIGFVLFLMSWLIDTPREKCIKRSRQLVAAVAGRDWPALSSLIAPQFKLSLVGLGNVYTSKEEMIAACKDGVDKYGLKTAKVINIEGLNTGDYIKVNLSVYSDQEYTMSLPIRSGWEFDWQEMKDGWQLTEIDAIDINGQSGEGIRRNFPRGR